MPLTIETGHNTFRERREPVLRVTQQNVGIRVVNPLQGLIDGLARINAASSQNPRPKPRR